MKMRILNLLAAALVAVAASSANAELIAYWDQNSNSLSGGGFGFEDGDFPQAADQGAGSLTWTGEPAPVGGEFPSLQSFSGTTENAQPGVISGGSIAPQNGSNGVNNGASIEFTVDTTLYTDIMVSWAQRGSSSGFDSREFSYSTDGSTFTSFATDTGTLTSSWMTEAYDLSAIDAIEGQSSVTFAITLDGGSLTSSNGNNRFDNITVMGTVIPEPATGLLALVGAAFVARRR